MLKDIGSSYRSYKQSIQYLFVEAGVFWEVRKGGERDSEGAVIKFESKN